MIESDILRLCLIEASLMGAVVWRNNTGAYKDSDRYIRYGLCVGSSDIIGIYKGRFLALEVKRKRKKPTTEQINFLDVVKKNGGIAGVVTCPEDVRNFLSDAS